MRLPRLTIGRLMIVVALAAVALVGSGIRQRSRYCLGKAERVAGLRRASIADLAKNEEDYKSFRKLSADARAMEENSNDPDIKHDCMMTYLINDIRAGSAAQLAAINREAIEEWGVIETAFRRVAARPWLAISYKARR